MKKTYEQPQVEVINLESSENMASNSPGLGIGGASQFGDEIID